MLQELVDFITRSLWIIFARSCHVGEVPEEWKKGSVTLIFKEGKNKELESYRLVNLTSVTENMMKICLEALFKEQSNWKL